MAKVSLQFHALPGELVDWAADWAAAHGLHVAVERFFPESRCVGVQGQGLASSIEQLGGVWNRIWLSKEPLRIDPSAQPPFVGQPECMVLAAGDINTNSLRESAVGAVSEDAAALRTWRSIVKTAKLHLRKGAWVVSPVSGARQRAHNHYYTEGALTLHQSGVKMLAVAGWNEFELDRLE